MNNPLTNDLNHILSHTEGLWDELRGQRLFITGGTGFLGCWLLESLAWANERLGLDASALVLTRDVDAFKLKAPHLTSNPAIQFHIGDAKSFEFPSGVFSHIIHAAPTGTRHALEFAVYCEAMKFLLTSSGAVYKNPISDYGREKLEAECLCAIYAEQHGIEAKIARCFAFVGPYLPLDAHFAVGNFIHDALHGGPVLVKGDGTPVRSYLYAADLAIWLWVILFRGETCDLFRGEVYRTYNVGSADEVTIEELAQVVARNSYPEAVVMTTRNAAPGQPVERYVPDVQRTEAELDLRQWIPLSEGIQRTIQWHVITGDRK